MRLAVCARPAPQALQAVFPEEGMLELAAPEAAALRFAQHVLDHAGVQGDGAVGPQDVGGLSGTLWWEFGHHTRTPACMLCWATTPCGAM